VWEPSGAAALKVFGLPEEGVQGKESKMTAYIVCPCGEKVEIDPDGKAHCKCSRVYQVRLLSPV
jgi:hypothetical protein